LHSLREDNNNRWDYSRILNAGETFYELPTAVHSVSRNPSTDKSTKIIVFMVADQKNPSTVAE
jgi:quercetin dioxygenase-like cupin family protein